MKRFTLGRALLGSLTFPTAIAALVILSSDATAVPSFSRQTGLTCNVCHSNPPELTAFGRTFKLEAYTLTDKKTDTSIEDGDLKISRYPPLSVMLVLSETATSRPLPAAQNDNVGFPQAFSLFLAGELSPQLGAMAQATYSHQSDQFTLDNTDIRYARHTTLGSQDLLCGITLNNSPTVEDVWNDTPSWGYPWLSANSAPTPGALPVIVGALAQDVAALGAYALWNDAFYLDFTLYRSEHAGGPQLVTGTDFGFNIRGAAPYWRLAWQQTWGLNYLEFGTSGVYLRSVPGGVSGTPDTYADFGMDLQYERPLGANLLSVHASYVHEQSDLDNTFAAGGADASSHQLNTLRADATCHVRRRYTLSLAGFSTMGNSDPVLFAPAPVTGSSSGSPNSSGVTGQLGLWPKENIELSAAYTLYATFNGARHGYDGSGRDASANNTVYVALWLNY